MDFKKFRREVSQSFRVGFPPFFIFLFIILAKKGINLNNSSTLSDNTTDKMIKRMAQIQSIMQLVTFISFCFAVPYTIAKYCLHKDENNAQIIGMAVLAVLWLALSGASCVITKLTEPEIFSNMKNKEKEFKEDLEKNYIFLCGILCFPITIVGKLQCVAYELITKRDSKDLIVL